MIDGQLLQYASLVLILTLTPGADTMLVIRNVIGHGQRAGLLTTAGICCGTLVHGLLSGAGLSLILLRSAEVYDIVKLAGALYLIFLGVQSLWALFRGQDPHTPDDPAPTDPKAPHRAFVEGLLSNVLNPKVAIFYLALLPQFIDPTQDAVLLKSVLMAGIHFMMGALWLSLVSAFVGAVRQVLLRPAVRRGVEGLAGLIMIGFGVRLALERS